MFWKTPIVVPNSWNTFKGIGSETFMLRQDKANWALTDWAFGLLEC